MTSLSVENSPWKKLWTCRKTNFVMNDARCFQAIFGLGFCWYSISIY